MSEREPDPRSPVLRDAEQAPRPRTLAEILDGLPTEPGCYLMKDRRGKIIYVGKAANLRARVRQYFQPNTGDVRDFVPLLEGIVGDIETVVTSNEKEALLLENTLIKKHQPRFNVKLTDDKNFLVLRLDPKAEWPRLEVGRKIREDGAWYFGPYHSATSAREALRVVNRHFQLRTCTDHVLHNRRRPCLQYQIKRCPAPCVLPVPPGEYADQVRDVRMFLEGKSDELLERLRARMKEAAAQTEFERAATVRDQIRALEASLQEQRVVSRDFVDQDVIGFHRDGLALEIVVLSIRQGKMVGSRGFSFGGQEFPDAELLSSFLGLYYDMAAEPPDEVLLPFEIADAALKAEWLSERVSGARLGRAELDAGGPGDPPRVPDSTPVPRGGRGRPRKVAVFVPQRGPRRDLLELARKNAAVAFASRRDAREDAEVMLAKLAKRLRLARPPRVIECYDISHVQGSDPVASQVVFVDGKPEKTRYRTYKVNRAAAGPANDDFAAMYEVLSRRFRRARELPPDDEDSPWRLPDLIVVDGGKGQLAMALAAARDVGVDTRPGTGLPIVALAKEREGDAAPAAAEARRPDRIFLPHAKDAIPIRASSAEMFVLQHLRDEAHRFAVAFHRGQRRRRTLRSALSEVPGIGAIRQRLLLRHFGSLRKIRDASVEELAAVPGLGPKAAAAVHAYFAARPEPGASPEPPPADDVAADEDAVESAFASEEPDLPDLPDLPEAEPEA